ncbi:MAG: nuclear transport factor 2 family protein [Gammaproteobacteria bacterium]
MDDEADIRAARAHYNAAILARDPIAIAACLTHDCALLASTGTTVTGHDALLNHWTLKFKQDAEVVYVRKPATIELRGGEAEEHGTWSGHWTHTGARVEGSGNYSAKWRREDDGGWRVASESFTPSD